MADAVRRLAARLWSPSYSGGRAAARAPLYAVVAVIYAATWPALWGTAAAGRFAMVAAGFALFAAVEVLADYTPAGSGWPGRGALAGQAVLVVVLNVLVPDYVTMVLYFVPAVRAFLVFTLREAGGWSLALAILIALQTGLATDLQHAVSTALVYGAGFAFFGTVITAQRRAQAARDRDEHLLGEISAAQTQLREQAERAQAQARELSTLLAVSRSVASTLEMEPLMGTILDQLKSVVDYTAASVRLIEGSDTLVMLAYRGPNPLSWRRARMALAFNPLNHEVVRRRGPLLIGDAHTDESPVVRAYREAVDWQHPQHAHGRSWLGVPLLVRDDAMGLIVLNHRTPHFYTTRHAELAQAFANHAAVAVDNARLYAEAQAAAAREERRARELAALYRADAQLYRHLQLDEVLHALVDVAGEMLHADKSAVFVWDGRHERLVPGASRGFAPETVARMAFSLDEGVTGWVAATGEAAVVEDALADPRVARWVAEREGIRSFLQVPIKAGDQVFGTFSVNYQAPRVFSADDQRLLLALGQRAALAIENARLYEQAQQAATLEERQRLARELHDAVTQTLFSASLIAEVLPRLSERDPAEGRRRLEELRQLTRGALAEMRTLLLELRPAALTEAPLRDLLRQLCDAVTGRARIPVALHVDAAPPLARTPGGETPVLPPDVQVTLYRIAQEALHNVVKHAGASRCDVTLREGAQGVEVRVADDGAGFDAGTVSAEHLGLRIMRERAHAIGAVLQIDSQPARGTSIAAVWTAPRPQSPSGASVAPVDRAREPAGGTGST